MNNVTIRLKQVLVLFFVVILGGCFGPSEDEVVTAMEASLRSMQASMAGQNLRLHERYDQAADMSFVNKDYTLLHTVKVAAENAKVIISGECIFAAYIDEVTRYTMNGSMTYQLRLPKNFDGRAASGEVTCKLALIGGRIKELEYFFSIAPSGQFRELTVSVNKKKFDMSRYKDTLNFMQYITPLKR
jgi:hypothetical protein